jgi:hypothetical protein
MIRPDIPYRTCANCTHIEDCEHPIVNELGSPITPNDCPKPDQIKLTSRVSELIPKE